jgi:P27 family predicted phage terminase small subunit
MPGRKASPYLALSSGKKPHRSNAELEKRRANEPKIDSARLRCPSRLSNEAKKEWRRLVKLYRGLEEPLLNDLDVNALMVYCEAAVDYAEAKEKLKFSEKIYARPGAFGPVPSVNPWVTIADLAAANMKKFGDILLLDPISRARVGLAKSKEENLSPMESYFKRKQVSGDGTR